MPAPLIYPTRPPLPPALTNLLVSDAPIAGSLADRAVSPHLPYSCSMAWVIPSWVPGYGLTIGLLRCAKWAADQRPWGVDHMHWLVARGRQGAWERLLLLAELPLCRLDKAQAGPGGWLPGTCPCPVSSQLLVGAARQG